MVRKSVIAALALWIPAFFCLPIEGSTATRALKLVALGDSLTAGYLLAADAAFPVVLEKALHRDGFNVRIVNAGVSGDTAEDGLARLDWSVQDPVDGVILELGANDMLRGADPAQTRHTVDQILQKLAARHIKVFLAGMRATPSLGPDYKRAFDRIYPDLAAQYGLPLYPFFLQGVAGEKDLLLADGLHPNPRGVETIVASILPPVEAWLRTIPASP